MAQKFVKLDEAAEQLGVSKDRLNELREAGKVRAYRDGSSWKFRSEDIEKLAADGIPAVDPGASDLALESDLSLDDSPDEPTAPKAQADSGSPPAETEAGSADTGDSGELELDLGDEEPAAGAASDVGLEEPDEPTVPVETAADDEIQLASEDDSDQSDSILLSENELGESTDRPPSTIIGKAEMGADLDLDLASESDAAKMSDVKLAPTQSNVLASGEGTEDVLDSEPPSMSESFADLDELEIDLEAESSRILAPADVEKAQQAAAKKSDPPAEEKPPETSDLELAPSDSGAAAPSGGAESGVAASSGGLSGLSSLELEDDDEDVLGDGSDITLSGESSGINLVSPSDSGLALDEVPLDLSGSSPIGSSIDLGSLEGEDIELEPLAEAPAEDQQAEGEEPFTLTPFGEEGAEEEEDSSQVIPLDEVAEDEAGGDLLGAGESESYGDDFATAGFGGGPATATAAPSTETQYSVGNIVALSSCLLLLMLCGMMSFDLVRNIWSWDQVYSINSTLLEVVNPFLG